MKRTRPAAAKKNARPSKVAKTKNQMVMYKNVNPNVRLIKRNANQGDINCILNVETYGAFTFQLNNVPKVTDFTGLFDQYKINAISLTFYPQLSQSSSIVAVTSIQNARVFTAIDSNDAAIPTALNDIREYDNCEVHAATEVFSVYIDKPKFVDATGALRTGYISTASPGILHYGLKYAVETLNPGSAGTYVFHVEAVYYMSFKSAK